jgi:hypothetical protein
MKTFSTSGTGNQQTLSPIESNKIPTYDSVADVEADLANLEEGQLVATPDTGDELAQPVGVVESGNLHAVTSNAVAEALNNYSLKKKTVTGTTNANGILYKDISNLVGTEIIINAICTSVNDKVARCGYSNVTGYWIQVMNVNNTLYSNTSVTVDIIYLEQN